MTFHFVGNARILACFTLLFLSGCSTLDLNALSAQELYERGYGSLEVGLYEEAIEEFDFLQAKYPFGLYTEYAWLAKSYAWHQLRQPRTAELELNQFYNSYPNHQRTDYVLFMLALLKESKGLTFSNEFVNDPARKDVSEYKQAIQRYQKLLDRFPESPYSATASKRIKILMARLARHEWYVVLEYQKRQAWVAVISRSQGILEQYPKTIYARHAVFSARDAYKQLSLDGLASEMQEMIEYNQLSETIPQ